MKDRVNSICIVVLAAGKSARLGRPKQLLSFGGETLVQHAVRVALEAAIGPVVVVTGANSDLIDRELSGIAVHSVFNPTWEEGMGASIRAGAEEALRLYPTTEGLLLMVCDQPFINAAHLQHLWETQAETRKKIVLSEYAGIRGTPALYHQDIFEELKALSGDKGARPILARHESDMATVPFASGETDIDTEADYENLLKSLNKAKT